MWSLLVAAAIMLVLAAATAGAALAWHVRRGRQRATEPIAAPYRPSSVDPRGRWRISRIDDAALEPAPYRLDTDSDDGGGNPLRPPARALTMSRRTR